MKSTGRTIGTVMIIMLLSRLMSLVSYQVYMAFFGTQSIEINVYSYAVNFPNIIFNSFGTALATVVIPIFAGFIAVGEKKRAYRFINNLLTIATAFSVGLTLVGIALAPLIPLLTHYNTAGTGYSFAVMALMIMFPVMIFYALNYIFQGVLQSLGRFNMPAFVSVPSSLIVILYVVLLGSRYGVAGLLVATLIGLSMQALILIPPIMRTEYRYKPSFGLRDKDIGSALKLTIPVLIGTSAYQINMLVNSTFATKFNSVTMIMYAQFIVLQLVLAFIFSVTAVIYPKITAMVAQNDIEAVRRWIRKILKIIIYLLAPATAGFILIRYELVDLLARWGKVNSGDVALISAMIGIYAAGIVGNGFKEVIDRAFYSFKDTRTPAINSVILMVVNIAGCFILTRVFGVLGIPLAYSIATLTGGATISVFFERKVGNVFNKEILIAASKAIASALIMAGGVILVQKYITAPADTGIDLANRLIKLIVPAGVGCVIYFAAACLMKSDEVIETAGKLLSRFRRRSG